jgi:hypothetical protein
MKFNIKNIILGAAVIGMTACTDLDTYLDNPNAISPKSVEVEFLFNQAFISFQSFAYNSSIRTMPYSRMTAMSGGRTYEVQDQPTSFDFNWRRAYADLLPDLDGVITAGADAKSSIVTGIAKIMKAYTIMTLVDLYGDVPYSESLKGTDQTNPKADKGADVYAAAILLLDDAIKDLNTPTGIAPVGDLLYGSSTTVATKAAAWKRAANSLKLRAYITTRLVDSQKDKVQALVNGTDLISSTAQDFQVQYSANRLNPDSRHPWYTEAYENGGPGIYMSNYYMWMFFGDKKVEDPRLRYYFYRQDCDETNEDAFTLGCVTIPYPAHWPSNQRLPFCTASLDFGDPGKKYAGYWGRDHGDASGIPPDGLKRTVAGVYPAAGKFDNNDCSQVSNAGKDGLGGNGILPILLYSNVEFMKAEAILTMGVTGDAKAALEKGVRASIGKTIAFAKGADGARKPSDSTVTVYVKEVLSLYDAATTNQTKLNVVITEAYLSLFGNGLDSYNNYRRTGMPLGMQPTLEPSPGAFARSMWYPSNFVNLNSSNKQKTNVAVKVFWDTNPDGFIK